MPSINVLEPIDRDGEVFTISLNGIRSSAQCLFKRCMLHEGQPRQYRFNIIHLREIRAH